jgi:hypothetical protein
MKYKLLKDLPGYKAGTVFEKLPNGQWYCTVQNNPLVPQWLLQLLDNETLSADWFQPIDDKPERQKKYTYWVEFRKDFKSLNDDANSIRTTEEGGKAIVEAVRGLLHFIKTGEVYESKDGEYTGVLDLMQAARKAIQDTNEKETN